MSQGAPHGEAVVLEVAQLEALLSKTFNLGLDVGRGKEKVALVACASRRRSLALLRRTRSRPSRSRSSAA
jgi:hypothetical protein